MTICYTYIDKAMQLIENILLFLPHNCANE